MSFAFGDEGGAAPTTSNIVLFPLFISFSVIYLVTLLLSTIALIKHFYHDRKLKHVHYLYLFLVIFSLGKLRSESDLLLYFFSFPAGRELSSKGGN